MSGYCSSAQLRMKPPASKWLVEEGNEVESVDPAYLPSISIIK